MTSPGVELGLSPRDQAALRWIGEQYAATLDQVQTVLGRFDGRDQLSAQATRTVVARWEGLGIVNRRNLFPGEPAWVWLTPIGVSRIKLRFRRWEPSTQLPAHIGAVNRVRLLVEKRRPRATWHSERAVRSARLGQAREVPLPDGEIHDYGDTVIAVEVEISPKNTTARRRVMQKLVGHYQAVWYFASADAWAGVHDAACQLSYEVADLVRIFALEDV